MSDVRTKADSLREYLTGAGADGDFQDDPLVSFGGYRSSVEAFSHGIVISNAIQGVVIEMASGANETGIGFLESVDSQTLYWTPPGESMPGPPTVFNQSGTLIVEGQDSSKFIRVRGTLPFDVRPSRIELTTLLENLFSMSIVPDADAAAGTIKYRGTILRNESNSDIVDFKRWISTLGTAQVSDVAFLTGTGHSFLTTSGSLSDWPLNGWCQVRRPGGTMRETVYYDSRDDHTLFVPNGGRGLLGTSAVTGNSADIMKPVPGIAIAFDVAGVQTFGQPIATIANENTAPAGVSWSLELDSSSGLSVPRLTPSRQIGFWIKRQIPASAIYSADVYNKILSSFKV